MAVTPNKSTASSSNCYWLFIGGDPVLDASSQVYKLASAISAYFYPGGGSDWLATSLKGDAKTKYSFQASHSSGDSRVFTHYGFGFTNGGSTFLLSYYQFPEPITVQPGETKTIQITIDVSNI